MKSVTIENVKARIAQLETSEQIGGRLPIRHEFEMACLRALVGKMAIEEDMHSVINLLANNEWAEHCTTTVLGSMLEAEVTRLVGSVQPAPVVPEDIPDSVYEILCQACGGKAWMYEDALWNACRAAMLNQAKEPATDNTAQQFESLATSTKCKRCDGEGWVADEMGITQCGCGATTSAGKVKS